MTNGNRLVYSTEHGQLDKPMRGKGRKKQNQQAKKPSAKNPAKQGARIWREVKGRGGKTVCVIDGLLLSDMELKVLLKKLKSQLGTGGSIKNGNLEIQGDHRDKLLILLANEGYKAKLAGG